MKYVGGEAYTEDIRTCCMVVLFLQALRSYRRTPVHTFVFITMPNSYKIKRYRLRGCIEILRNCGFRYFRRENSTNY